MTDLKQLHRQSCEMYWNGRVATAWDGEATVTIYHADDNGNYAEVDSFTGAAPMTTIEAEREMDRWWREFYKSGGDDMLGRPSDRFHAAQPEEEK